VLNRYHASEVRISICPDGRLAGPQRDSDANNWEFGREKVAKKNDLVRLLLMWLSQKNKDYPPMALDARGVPKDEGGKEGKVWIESWTTIKYTQSTQPIEERWR